MNKTDKAILATLKTRQGIATLKVNEALKNGISKVEITNELGISYPTIFDRLKNSNWTKLEIFYIINSDYFKTDKK